MKRSKRLSVVLTLAEKKERDAGQVLAQSRQVVVSGEQRLQELNQYMLDYQNNWAQSGASGVTSGQVQAFSSFFERLQDVIRKQEQHLHLARAQVEQHARAWQQAYNEKKNLADFIERCRQEEAREDDKKLQIQMDEAAQRRFFNRQNSGGFGV